MNILRANSLKGFIILGIGFNFLPPKNMKTWAYMVVPMLFHIVNKE